MLVLGKYTVGPVSSDMHFEIICFSNVRDFRYNLRIVILFDQLLNSSVG